MRVSVTLLDSFRYWKQNEFWTEEAEQKALEELIARIRGEKLPQTDAMLRGIAWHKIAEDPHKYYDPSQDVYGCEGWTFNAADAGVILMDLPAERVCEVKMEIDVGPVQLVGIADYIDGCNAGDLKLSKKVEPDKYGESLQWMAYLRMMDGKGFRYHVAQPRTDRKTGAIKLADYKAFPFYRSPHTDAKVEEWCHEFYTFAQPYLEDAA